MNKLPNPESQNIEYKESWRDEYLKWICGFANAQGGSIYIGVNDNLGITGVENAKKLMEDIPNKISNFLGIMVDVNLLQSDGLEYLEINVSPSNIPISYKGIYFYRAGSTLRELTGVALQDFLLRKQGRNWDELIEDRATLDDIDPKAINHFIRRGIASQRIPESMKDASIEEVLTSLKMMNTKGELTKAAVLVFGKDPLKFIPLATFNIGRFTNELQFHDVIESNLIQMADRVMEVLQSKYLVALIKFEGMVRNEYLEIPEEALREIIYNALAHKLYVGPHIQMKVYDDRIELWNYGELPSGYDMETLLKPHASFPRNPNIANALFRAGFIDAWGHGFEKIETALKVAGLALPTVENHCGGVRVTIKRSRFKELSVAQTKHIGSKDEGENIQNEGVNVQNEGVTVKNEGVNQLNISKNENRILNYLTETPSLTYKDLANKSGLSEASIERGIKSLKEKGIIKREGSDKKGRWIII